MYGSCMSCRELSEGEGKMGQVPGEGGNDTEGEHLGGGQRLGGGPGGARDEYRGWRQD